MSPGRKNALAAEIAVLAIRLREIVLTDPIAESPPLDVVKRWWNRARSLDDERLLDLHERYVRRARQLPSRAVAGFGRVS